MKRFRGDDIERELIRRYAHRGAGNVNQRGHEARNAMISKAITEGKPAGRKVVNPHPDKLRAWKGERGRLVNAEINSYYKQYLVNSYLKNLKAIY